MPEKEPQPEFHPDPVGAVSGEVFFWAEDSRDFCMYGSVEAAEAAIVDHKLDGVKISRAQVGLSVDRKKVICEPYTMVRVACDAIVACFASCQEEQFDFAEGKPWVDFAPDIVHVFRDRFKMRIAGKLIDVTFTEAAEQPS